MYPGPASAGGAPAHGQGDNAWRFSNCVRASIIVGMLDVTLVFPLSLRLTSAAAAARLPAPAWPDRYSAQTP